MINRLVSRHVLHFIVSGEGWCNGYPVKEGDVIYFKDYVPYNFSSNPENPCVYVWITFKGDKCNKILENLGLIKNMHIYTTKNIKEIFSVMYEMIYVSQSDVDVDLYLEARLYRILSLAKYNSPEKESEDAPEALVEKRVYTAMKFIAENYKKPDLRVTDIAERVKISANYLRKLFKEETGMSVRDYIIKMRINAAQFLLETSNYNINEITEYVGFSDYRQFSELFKKKTGILPSKYRNMKKPIKPDEPKNNIK